MKIKILAVLLFTLPAFAGNRVHTIKWGESTFKINVPDDHQPANEAFFNSSKTFVPPKNELIAAFQTKDSFRYTLVQGFLPFKDKYISEKYFASIKAGITNLIKEGGKEFKGRNEKTISQWEKAAQDSLGSGSEFQFGVPMMFPPFDASKNHISSQMLTRFATKTETGQASHVVLASWTSLRQNGKVINIYNYVRFKDRNSYYQQQAEVSAANKETISQQ